jgi:hypothetical protein
VAQECHTETGRGVPCWNWSRSANWKWPRSAILKLVEEWQLKVAQECHAETGRGVPCWNWSRGALLKLVPDSANCRNKRLCNDNFSTERPNEVVNTSASYSGGPWFKSLPQDMLPWLRFFVVFQSPQVNVGVVSYNWVTTGSLQIISNSSFACHPMIRRYTVFVTEK